jgi:hypothetical protein
MSGPRRRTGLRAAALVLLAFSAALLLTSFVHTDDGCAVERHCSSCLRVLAGSSLPCAVPAPTPVIAPAEAVELAGFRERGEGAARLEPPRGPPPA